MASIEKMCVPQTVSDDDMINVSLLTPDQVVELYHQSQLPLGWPKIVSHQPSAHLIWEPAPYCPHGRWELGVRTERYKTDINNFGIGCDNAIRYRWLPGYGLEIGTAC